MSAVTLLTSTILFVCTCAFTTPAPLWQIKAFPVDLRELPAFCEDVSPSGEITCSLGYDEGAIVVNSFISVVTDSGTLPSPAAKAGVKIGDVITKINNQVAKSSDFLTKGSHGESISVTVIRGEENSQFKEHTITITPVYSTEEKKHMVGITYYDASMVGVYSTVQTISFTYPSTGYFAATAHSSDTGLDSDSFKHILTTAKVDGRDDGGIHAIPEEIVGEISVMNRYGSFGVWKKEHTNLMPLGKKQDLRLGKAIILSDFEGGEVKEYEAYITGTYRIDSRDVISLIVTDKRILDAGGITKGMSGSPVILNGKLIGALSNTDRNGYCAYATFASDMAHQIYLNSHKFTGDE